MGLREANQRFSHAIKAVKAGQEVVLTERGRPIAVIKPLPRTDQVDPALERLAARGIVRLARKPGAMRPFKPIRIDGPPITETLREERDED